MTMRRSPHVTAAYARASLLALASVGCAVAGGCAPGREGLLDPCDGVDGDGDGTVDEGSGEAIGCHLREVCVAGACSPPCGDGFCDDQEYCWSCAADCGACPACGDGTCDPGEDCATCAADCGACPACGDGACNGAETCSTCRDDCGLCPGECTQCGDGFSCPGGLVCGTRICDGVEACYRTAADATCPEVDGEPCPSVPAYAPCTSDAQCGAFMGCHNGHCTPADRHGAAFPSMCTGTDGADVFCPPAPSSPAGLSAECVDIGGIRCCYVICRLRCTGACPYGMTCTSGWCY